MTFRRGKILHKCCNAQCEFASSLKDGLHCTTKKVKRSRLSRVLSKGMSRYFRRMRDYSLFTKKLLLQCSINTPIQLHFRRIAL